MYSNVCSFMCIIAWIWKHIDKLMATCIGSRFAPLMNFIAFITARWNIHIHIKIITPSFVYTILLYYLHIRFGYSLTLLHRRTGGQEYGLLINLFIAQEIYTQTSIVRWMKARRKTNERKTDRRTIRREKEKKNK